MKKILMGLMSLVMITACSDGSDSGSLPNDPPRNMMGGDGEPNITVNGEKPEDYYDQFVYQRKGTCQEGFEHKFLSQESWYVKLDEDDDGLSILAHLRLFLFDDGTYLLNYKQFRNLSTESGTIRYSKTDRYYLEKSIRDDWFVEGEAIRILGLGSGTAIKNNNRAAILFRFEKNLGHKGLAGTPEILQMRYSNTGYKEIEEECVESQTLGVFEKYEMNRDIDFGVGKLGLEIKNASVGYYTQDVDSWDFKLFLNKNGEYQIEFKLVTDLGEMKGLEIGKWTRSGKKLYLGELAELTVHGLSPLLTFKNDFEAKNSLGSVVRVLDVKNYNYFLDESNGSL